MIFLVIATLCAGLFSGAAVYVTAVEHPRDPGSALAAELLAQWGRLHAVRSVASVLAFAILLARLGGA